MKTVLSSDKKQYKEIYERTRTRTIRYRLFKISTGTAVHYEICVDLGNERAVCTVPFSDERSIMDVYDQICSGLVTPTTLRDVIEDMS